MVGFFDKEIEYVRTGSSVRGIEMYRAPETDELFITSEILKYTRSNILQKYNPCKRSHLMVFASRHYLWQGRRRPQTKTMQGGIERIEIWCAN
jgi:hypothetical protein